MYVIITELSGRTLPTQYAAVAQLDRVFGYEPKGRGFESLQPYQKRSSKDDLFFFYPEGGIRTLRADPEIRIRGNGLR